MAKSNKNIILSEKTEHNISFLVSTTSFFNEQNLNIKKSNYHGGKKIFEIFHKKEIILNEININDELSKNQEFILYKCIYCENKYNNINRFEAHMKIHVSYK